MPCKLYNCTSENPCHYCKKQEARKHPKYLKRTPIEKKPYEIPKQSKKRAKQNREYLRLRKQFLTDNPMCEAKLTGCTGVATTCHHSKGRIGDLLTDTEHFVALCMPCHHQVETQPEMAKQLGLSKSRLKK